MSDDFLGTVLIAVVLVLLVLDIIIAIFILKLLLTARRAAKLVEAIVDDVENFTKLIRKFSWPVTLRRVIKKLAHHLPDDSKSEK